MSPRKCDGAGLKQPGLLQRFFWSGFNFSFEQWTKTSASLHAPFLVRGMALNIVPAVRALNDAANTSPVSTAAALDLLAARLPSPEPPPPLPLGSVDVVAVPDPLALGVRIVGGWWWLALVWAHPPFNRKPFYWLPENKAVPLNLSFPEFEESLLIEECDVRDDDELDTTDIAP
jgi:hypothetical protein